MLAGGRIIAYAAMIMGGIIEIAGAILANSVRSTEVSAYNIANQATPGFKRRVDFARLLTDAPQDGGAADGSSAVDRSAGKMVATGAELDLAIAGEGFFVLRSDDRLTYTRNGQFSRDGDGRLTAANGQIVQDRSGRDVRLGTGDVQIVADGTILEDGAAVGQLAIVEFPDSAGLVALEGGFIGRDGTDPVAVERPVVRQGMLETSNVSVGDEMVAMMAALRRAESGQRVIGIYDDLMGRAITAFGQG